MKLISSALLVLCLAASAQAQQEIKVGGIFDLTGITSDVGKPYAQGVRDAVAWTNENGGINGKKIRLIDVDTGYKIPEAVATYKRMAGDEKVIMINGWATGDTEALKGQVAQDKIPYVSASFSAISQTPRRRRTTSSSARAIRTACAPGSAGSRRTGRTSRATRRSPSSTEITLTARAP